MQLIQDRDVGETYIGCRIGLRWRLDGVEMQFGGTGCGWDVTWIKVRHKYQDLHWGDTRPGWRWDVNLRYLEGNDMEHKLGWAIHPQNWMGVSWYLDEIVLQICRAGWKRGRRWDTIIGTRMEVRSEPSDPHGGQMVHGRKWFKYIGIWF